MILSYQKLGDKLLAPRIFMFHAVIHTFSIRRFCALVGATDYNANETEYQFPKEILTVYRNGNSNSSGNNPYFIALRYFKVSQVKAAEFILILNAIFPSEIYLKFFLQFLLSQIMYTAENAEAEQKTFGLKARRRTNHVYSFRRGIPFKGQRQVKMLSQTIFLKRPS